MPEHLEKQLLSVLPQCFTLHAPTYKLTLLELFSHRVLQAAALWVELGFSPFASPMFNIMDIIVRARESTS